MVMADRYKLTGITCNICIRMQVGASAVVAETPACNIMLTSNKRRLLLANEIKLTFLLPVFSLASDMLQKQLTAELS